MSGFRTSKIVVSKDLFGSEWEVLKPIIYGDIVVPSGQTTDFASVIAMLRWVVDKTTGVPAAILHDYLWRVLVPTGQLTYREADRIFRDALLALRVSKVRSWLMWAAVRWGALLTRRGGSEGWLRDAPAVLLVTLLALPLVAVPAATALVALAVLWLLDRVC